MPAPQTGSCFPFLSRTVAITSTENGIGTLPSPRNRAHSSSASSSSSSSPPNYYSEVSSPKKKRPSRPGGRSPVQVRSLYEILPFPIVNPKLFEDQNCSTCSVSTLKTYLGHGYQSRAKRRPTSRSRQQRTNPELPSRYVDAVA